MPVTHVKSEEHFEELINTKKHDFIFVDFYADWCGPCKRIAPKLEEMSTQFPSVLFVKVNVDELEDLSQRYNVSCMPTFLVFKRSSMTPEYEPVCGASEDKIRNLLKTATNSVVVSDEF